MASLSVHAPDGKTLTVQVPEGTDPSQYGHFADDALSHYTQSTEQPSFQSQIPGILKQAGQAVLGSSPANLTQKFMETDPGTMTRMAGPALPIVGGMAGMASPIPGGAAAGAMIGEGLRQSFGSAFAPETVAKTIPGQMASIAATGILQEPKILNEIPGMSKVGDLASGMLSKMGKGAARFGETLTGVKAKDLTQAAEQGLSTYAAPSLEKASIAFGKAIGKEGEKALEVPASEAFDPALGKAREFAKEIGAKIEKGEPISSIDALKARQATDRIISSTPVTDKLTRRTLYDWRSQFDDIIATQNGPLKDASTDYRKAIVKDKILNLTRLNKSGEPSAFLPMLVGHGMMGKGVEAGLGMLTGTSPLAAGLAATAGGSAVNAIRNNPAARQVLLQVLQRIQQGKKE